jgi:DNA helicase-2/ATP-dependent DNA helicase PcrA
LEVIKNMAINGNKSKCDDILCSPAEKICVIAGPGTGKTSGILIPKVKQIILDQGINPETVLVISFSRLSAQDLKKKLKIFDRIPRTSTLHSFCLSFLLSEDNHDIRKRIETILTDCDKRVLLSDLKVVLPKISKKGLEKMLSEFSVGWALYPHDDVFNENDIQKSFKAALLNWLDEYEAAMMEEIVYNAVNLAKKIRVDFIEKPQYILVDEFQDLNKLEQEFVNLLGARSKLVLVVGDPDQSIYSFKYAHPDGIKYFAESDDVESHTLEYSVRCAKKIINIANQLLKQADPGRTELLQPLPDAMDGEVFFKGENMQEDEFNFVLNSIVKKVKCGVDPEEIIVLVPRNELGHEFAKFAQKKQLLDNLSFKFILKDQYSETEQEKLLLLGILANPKSLLRIRSYVGIKDDRDNYAEEFTKLKQKYGNIQRVIQNANSNDFNIRKKRLRDVCSKLQEVRDFIEQHKEIESIDAVLNEIFPPNVSELQYMKNILTSLREEADTLKTLYQKFIDHTRVIEVQSNVIRIMSLLSSKGLDAEHIFIMGCNDGNIPGKNNSSYLSDYEYKQEKRRLLFVGITRAKKSLTITWCRNIPYSQSRRQKTESLRTITINGKKYSQVGLSEFLQNVDF